MESPTESRTHWAVGEGRGGGWPAEVGSRSLFSFASSSFFIYLPSALQPRSASWVRWGPDGAMFSCLLGIRGEACELEATRMIIWSF